MLFTRLVILVGTLVGLAACDAFFNRRIDIAGPDRTAFAIDGAGTRAAVSTLREYSAQANLDCPSTDELPFECRRASIRIRAELSGDVISVSYYAMGAAFDAGTFARRMDSLEALLVTRFGAPNVSDTSMCPLLSKRPPASLPAGVYLTCVVTPPESADSAVTTAP
jgi:hypothetical protein